MTTLAIVVSLVGQAWAESANGERRALEVGDRLGVDETLIMETGARVDLDFGDNQQLTFLGEQQVSAEDRGALIEQAESLAPLESSEQPAADAPAYSNDTAAPEGHGFVQLVRIGEIIEADGFTPVTVARIQEVLRPFGLSLPQRDFVRDEHDDNRFREEGYPETGAKLSKLSISVNVIAGDDVVDATEAGQTITLTGTVGGGVKPGDAVTVTVNDKEYGATVNADGRTWQVDVPGSELAKGNNVHATINSVEPNGTPVSADTERPYGVDDVTPGATVELEGAGPDGIYSESEITNGTVPGNITLNPNTEPGDTILVTDGKGNELINRPVTQDDIDNGIIVDVPVTPGQSNAEINVELTDPAGNISSTSDDKPVDNLTPGMMVDLEGAGSDGIYNESEITNGTVPGKITLDPNTTVGDNLVVTDGKGAELVNRPVTQGDIDNGIVVDVPVTPGQTQVDITATTSDPAGNTHTVSDSKPVDNVTPTLTAELEGVGSDGVYNADEITDGKVSGKVSLDSNTVEVGDLLVIQDGSGTVLIDRPVTQDDINDGVSVDISVSSDDTRVEISATITDSSGNSSDDADNKVVDNVTPMVEVELADGSSPDGSYNKDDADNGTVEGTINLDSTVSVGDSLVVTDGKGNTLFDDPVTQADIDNGITVQVPIDGSDTELTLDAVITDEAGNTSNASDDKPVDAVTPTLTAELEGAGSDGVYNIDEITDGKVTGKVTLDSNTVEVGDRLVIQDGSGTVLIDRPVTQADINDGVSVDISVSSGDTEVEISATITDPAGNTSDGADTKGADNVTPTLEVELEPGSGPNGEYNDSDTNDGKVEGTITFGPETQVGDKVIVTDKDGNPVLDGNGDPITDNVLTQNDINNGITVEVPVGSGDTDVELNATVTDDAGNATTGSDNNDVDNITPGANATLEPGSGPNGEYDGDDTSDGKVEGTVELGPTTEVGDTVKVTDKDGNIIIERPVTQDDIDNNITVDIPVVDGQTNVEINVEIADPAGNSSNADDSNPVDNVTPTVEVELKLGSGPNGSYNEDDTVDGKVEGTVTLDPGNTEPGDTIVVTDGNGEELINREVTQDDIDNGITVDVPVVPGQTDVELNATVTDPAGNASDGQDDNDVDNVGPGASVELEPGNGPGDSYNEGDITDGTVTGDITLSPGTVPGDTIVVTDGNGNELINRPVTQDDIDNGISVEVPVEPGQPNVEVNVELTDPAGNTSDPITDNKDVDNVTPTVEVELADGSSPDGSYNKEDADNDTVEGTIKLDPNTTKPGDNLVVTDGKGNTLFDDSVTQANIDNGVTVQVPITDTDTELELNAEITDEAGNSSTDSADKPVDSVTPTLTAELEGAGGDDVYNVGEITDGKVNGLVSLDSNTVEIGDRLVIQDGSGTVLIDRPVTQSDINDGVRVGISVSSGDTSVDIKATITDPSGNSSDDADNKAVDNITPTVEVDLESGSGPNGEYTESDTSDGKVKGTITFGPETQVGDKVTVTDKDGTPVLDSNGDPITDYEVTQDDINNGIIVDVPVVPGQTDVELNATVTDLVGNTSDGQDDNDVDNVGPGASVELEPGNGPGDSYNEDDITDGTVTGDITLSPGTEPGDTIVVTDGKGNELINRPVTQDDIDNGGKISVEVPIEPGQTDVEINVELTDPAGNTGTATDNKDVDNVTPQVNVELDTGNGLNGDYNEADTADGEVTGTVTFPEGTESGDRVVVTDKDGDTLLDKILNDDDIANGIEVDVPVTPGQTDDVQINAEITDNAGNSSNASDTKPVDNVAPQVDVELEAGSGPNGEYNESDISNGKVSGTVTFPGGTEPGDRVVVTDNNGTVVLDKIVNEDDIANGIEVEVPVTPGQTDDVQINAEITDPTGNSSNADDSNPVDNVTPTIDVTLDGAGADGIYSAGEITNDEVTATITLDDTVIEGDTLEFTDGNGDPIAGLPSQTVTQADIDNGTITVQVPVDSGDTDIELNATITDNAGNSSSASDNKPVALGVELSIADDTVTEGGSTTITATMDNVSDQDVTITLNDGSQITIPAGQQSADVTVESRPDDEFVQGDEDREYEIVSVTGSGYEHINIGESADLTIQDDEDPVTVKLDASASVEEGGEITYTARLEDASGNSITANNDIAVTLNNGETITISAGQAYGDVTIDAPTDDVYQDGETISNNITEVKEVDASNNPVVNDAPGSLESLEADNTEVETDIIDTKDTVELTISAPERADEGSDIEITLTVSETPETDLVITLTDGTEVTIAAGETEKTVTVTAPNNNENLGAGGATSGELPGDWNIGIGKTEGGNYEDLDTPPNAVVQIDLDVPGLDIPDPDSQVDEAGLQAGSDSSSNSEETAGTFTIAASDVDDLATVDIGSESFTLQQLINASSTPLTAGGEHGTLTITGYDESSGKVNYSYTLTSAADHSNGDVSDDFDITVTDTSGDSRTGTLEVGIVDDVPTAVNGDLQEATEGGADLTGNLIDNGTVGADGAFVNQISYTNSSGNLAEAYITEGDDVTVDTQYGELTVNSDGSWTYTPVDSADHSATDPGVDKGLELSDDFSYTLIDGDGDISNQATQQITVKDTVPEVGAAADATVDEQYLLSGTNPNSEELTKTGSLDLAPGKDTFDTVFDEANRGDLYAKGLTSGGETLHYELSEDGHTLTATADGKPVFTVTITDPTGANAGYEFTLNGPLDNVSGVVNSDGNIELPLSFTVEDSDGDTAQGDFTVTVQDNPDSAADQEITLDEDSSETLKTPANATQDNITISDGSDGPEYGEVVVNDDGTLTYTPNDDYSGGDSFSYTYTEGDITHTVNVDVTVNPVADAPDLVDGSVETLEDTPVDLNLTAPSPVDTTDQNDGEAGDNPELLGPITLSGIPSGTELFADQLDGTGAVSYTSDGSDLTIVLSDVDHIAGLPDGSETLVLTTEQYEALQVNPIAQSHENFSIDVSVTSYEVDSDGNPLSEVDGAESTVQVDINVQAVTDDVDLTIDGSDDPYTANIDEDISLDLGSLLGASFEDLDGSEERSLEIDGVPEGSSVTVNGNTIVAGSDGTIVIPAGDLGDFGAGESTEVPSSLTLTPPTDFSGNINGITVTLKAEDQDSDEGDDSGAEKEDSVTLNINVAPIADKPADISATGVEDTEIAFLSDLEVADTDNTSDQQEDITEISIDSVPDGWVIKDGDGTVVHTGDGSGDFTIPSGDVADGGYTDYTITPPAHSSVDESLSLQVTVKDTDGTNTDTKIHNVTADITVTPNAEEIAKDGEPLSDSDGDGAPDLTINPDHEYDREGTEDTWFNLGSEPGNDSFNLGDNWGNQDADGSEETFALLTPKLIAGDGAQADAKGSVFRYSTNGDTSEEGGAWITQTFGGDAIEIPVEYLDTLQFLAPSNFSGQFEIKVEALTRDTDPDDGAVVEQISGESTLTNILIKPVADRPTTSVTARVTGDEDEKMDLSIRPSSSDPSETFNVTIDKIPDGAEITYDGKTLTADATGLPSQFTLTDNGDGTWKVEIKNFSPDQGAGMEITPPLHSNEPFELQIGTQSVDKEATGDEYISDSFDLSVKVTPKGVADEANITIKDVDGQSFTEEALDNAGGVDLKELVTAATLKDDDGSETLSFKIGNLPDGFGIEGATALGNGEWSFSKKDFDDNNIKITTPKNFNGTKSFTLYSVTTEDDGDSLTVAHDVAVKVTPSPEATMNTSTSVNEDETAALDFGIQYQNGDTDESITGVWINALDVDDNPDFVLTYGANGSPLANGQDGVLLENGYYKLSGAALDNIHVKGSVNWSGDANFGVRYEVTDPAKDSTVSDATEITQTDESYTVTVNPVTDQPTLEVTNGEGADNSFTASASGEEVTVNLNIGNDDGMGGSDYDGSETLTRILLENVPQGVVVEGADYIGNDQWLFIKDDEFNGPLSESLTLRFTDGAGDLTNHKIDITVTTEDANNGESLTVKDSIDVSTSFGDDGGSDEPAEIIDWSDNDFAPTEDTEFSLNDAINGEIEDNITGNGFSVTLSGLPEGTQVAGMTATQIDGQTVWTASGTGGNSELQALLEDIKVTPPENWNSNDGSFHFNAKLTTSVPSGQRTDAELNLSQQVTPVSDAPEVDINAPAVDEGNDLTFSFDISNPADDPGANWNLVDGKLYLKLDDSDINDGGSLVDSNGDPLVTETITGGNGLTAGDYYVVNVGGSNSVDVTYKPNNSNSSGSVSVEGWIQSEEEGASNQIFGQGSQTADINPVNSGYDFIVGNASGTENSSQQVAGDKSNLIELDITDNGLVDDDGSESLQTVLLSNLPEGFLVYVGDDADSATEAALSNNAGGDGITNTWLLGQGEMPGYVAIMPPQHWSGTLSDLKLQVISGENELGTQDVSEQDFDLTVEAQANGIESLNPTPSFGTEGEIINLNLNHELVDPIKAGDTDKSVETLTLEFQGMGEYAAFYADLNGDGEQTLLSGTNQVNYDEGTGNYAVSGLTSAQAETLGFKQAAKDVDGLQVRAQTEERSNGDTSDWTGWEEIPATITEQFGTTGDDSLLYTGEYIDGRGDQAETGGTGDTIQLRFGEDLSASDLATNLANIETLDLSIDGSNAIGNNLSGLSIEDVLNITDGDNALKIDGDGDDSVFLKNNEWTNDGSNGSGYVVYTDTTSGAQLSISEQITSITMVD